MKWYVFSILLIILILINRLLKCLNIIQEIWGVNKKLCHIFFFILINLKGTMRLGRRTTHFTTDDSILSMCLFNLFRK
jgi:hypothetical protein